jgi:hypothetical protein
MKITCFLCLIFSFLFVSCGENVQGGRCIECTGLLSFTKSACEDDPQPSSDWSPSFIEDGYTWEDHVAGAMYHAHVIGETCTETNN